MSKRYEQLQSEGEKQLSTQAAKAAFEKVLQDMVADTDAIADANGVETGDALEASETAMIPRVREAVTALKNVVDLLHEQENYSGIVQCLEILANHDGWFVGTIRPPQQQQEIWKLLADAKNEAVVETIWDGNLDGSLAVTDLTELETARGNFTDAIEDDAGVVLGDYQGLIKTGQGTALPATHIYYQRPEDKGPAFFEKLVQACNEPVLPDFDINGEVQ